MEVAHSKMAHSWQCYSRFLSPRVYDRVLRLFSNSTNPTSYPSSSSSSSSPPPPPPSFSSSSPSLYQRIYFNGDPSVSMVPILDQWLLEGRQISPRELQYIITRLRSLRRFSHALQVSEWMKERYSSTFTSKDAAALLELISKVKGICEAEKYFMSLPYRSPVFYSALLKSFANARLLNKAEAVMQKMKHMGFANSQVPYNIMLKLYFNLELYDKCEQMIQEMEERGFSNGFSYVTQLTSYSTAGKVKEMEAVLMKMEADPMFIMIDIGYITAASGYLKAGMVDKALLMLRRAERLAKGKIKKHVYNCLLTIYARANVREEVFRLWNLYKRSWVIYNTGHLCMVSALVILDDLEGAERIVDEWTESSCVSAPDFTVINPLVRAYCKKDDMERAEELIARVRDKFGVDPHRSNWVVLAFGYLNLNLMESAVKAMKKALTADGVWSISKVSLLRCLEFLKMKSDPEELQKFTGLLEQNGYDVKSLTSNELKDTEGQRGSADIIEKDLESRAFFLEKASQ